jgi:hypothetical protein
VSCQPSAAVSHLLLIALLLLLLVRVLQVLV